MKQPNLILILLTLLTFGTRAQDLTYEIVRNGNPIGSLDVDHTVNGETETFKMRNVVDFRVIFTFSVEYVLTETFENGKLMTGEGFNTLNSISQKETKIRWAEDGYHLKIDGVEAHNEKKPIYDSMAKMYHEEPENGKKLYSQYFGRYLTIVKTGDHKYSLKSPDGENVYTYSNGYCTEVKVIRDFATFYIKMKPETLATIKKMRGN